MRSIAQYLDSYQTIMARLEISLLGSPKIKLDGKLLTGLTGKPLALLTYLVVTKQQQTRERLAEMLFSDESKSREEKLSNLRGNGALMKLNVFLGDFVESPKFSVAFKTETDYWLDVDEFLNSLRSPHPTPEQLQKAVDLYRAEFLTGLRLRDAAGFEEWAEQVRRALETQMTTALYLLTVHYKEHGQYAPAIATITRLLGLNPYFEEANRELMLLLALMRQINEACSHYERYEALLAEDGLEPEPETTALYQKIWRGEIPADTAVIQPMPAPPPQTWSPPFQAPPPLPHFVGRETVRETIMAALQADDEAHIQALVGMGGVGKSSLAGEVARALQEHFSDGVLWATVAVSEPTAVLESWAQAYGYDFSRLTDLESMASAFRSVLADKRVLLVLDDVVSVSRIRPLLPNGPHCRVLLTTRGQDLAYGLDAQVWRLGELSAMDGRRLLTYILGEERVQAEPEAATQICDLLQNLPLAVEIIGQRLRSRPRRQLADVVPRLRDEKQRLSELKISDRAVRASFAISYDTLDADERQMFALMGLFNGRSFAADLMAGVAGHDRYETEDRIFALVALSLAQEEGATRYQQHPLLADFAREKLLESGEAGGWYGRMAHTYLAFARQHQHNYDALRPEWDNLMAAMQAAHEYELWQEVIEFADALHDAWFARGRYTQARQGFQWALEAAHLSENTMSLANSYLHLGETHLHQSNYGEAYTWVTKGLPVYQQMRDHAGISEAHYLLGQIMLEQRNYDDAAIHLEQSISMREEINDMVGLAAAFVLQAHLILVSRSKDFREAELLLEKALELQENKVENSGLVTTYRLLARTAIFQKEYDKAVTYCRRALTLCDLLADQHEKAYTLYTLSVVYDRLDEFEEALRYNQEAMALFERMGDQKMVAASLHALSGLRYLMGADEEALELSLRSLTLFRNLQDRYNLVHVLQHLCRICTRLHQKEKATQYCLEALSLARQDDHMEYENISRFMVEKGLLVGE
jgi:DNA-binding SARP family transcriptional activator